MPLLSVSFNAKHLIILTFFLLCLSTAAFAQLAKDQWLIGGNAAFSYFKYYSQKNTTVSVAPAGGYFFLNRLAGGLRVGYDRSFSSYPSSSTLKERFISVLPFVRYYFLPEDRKINLFADGGYGYSWGLYKFERGDFSYRSKIISLKAGPAFILNEHTSLEFSLGYTHSIAGGINDTLAINTFQFGVGFQIHIGKQKE